MNWTNSANYKTKWPDPLPTINYAVSGSIPTNTTGNLAKPATQKQVVTQWLLDKLQEESAEVIQAVSKVRRFGQDNHHPERKQTNLEELITELEDFLAIVAALEHTQYFDLTKHQQNIHKKTLALISS
jgi:NTP pyrophosphatase (non-canonical NTP hydrolase)